MNIGEPLRVVEREVRPNPYIITPATRPDEAPIYVPDWPVREPEPAGLPDKEREVERG